MDNLQKISISNSASYFEPLIRLYKPEFIRRLTPDQARGIIWIFEPPRTSLRYILAGDPSVGIPGWHRGLSTEADLVTDNAAAIVLAQYPDKVVQVAEFAAPVEPVEFARILNALGHYYAGSDPLGMAHLILESCVGPGPEVERALLYQHQYFNYFTMNAVSQVDISAAGKLGWRPSLQSNKDISLNFRRVVEAQEFVCRSPWLADELGNAEMDREKWKLHVPAGGKNHDDRLRAAMLGTWVSHGSEIVLESAPPQPKAPSAGPKKDWQSSAISLEQTKVAWNRRFWEIANGSE